MKDEKGFITIISLIILTSILVLIVAFFENTETDFYYIKNSLEGIQHNYILESHLNILLNREKYRSILDDFILFNLEDKLIINIKGLIIEENIKNNNKTSVNFKYNKIEDIVIIDLTNKYKGMNGSINIEINPINNIYLENEGYLDKYMLEEEKQDKFIRYLKYLEVEVNENNSEELIIAYDDIIINNDVDFSGIIISTGGKLIVKEGYKLKLKGLLLTQEESIGNIEIEKDKKIIKKVGLEIPGFIEYKIINKKIN